MRHFYREGGNVEKRLLPYEAFALQKLLITNSCIVLIADRMVYAAYRVNDKWTMILFFINDPSPTRENTPYCY